MSIQRWTALAVMSLQVPAVTLAKPAGLPVDLQINYAAAEAPTPPRTARPADDRAADVFQRAERQRLIGQLEDARRGYEEAHLLAPTSRAGTQAIQRLRELDGAVPHNDFSEEQEPPLNHQTLRPNYDPRPTRDRLSSLGLDFLNMLRRTKPLEMAPVEME